MDTDVIALRSSDDVLSLASRRATVMAEELGVGLCNALIMSAPKAPFIRRWMEKYRYFNDISWNKHSVVLPYKMYIDGDPDITVLDSHTWFYPMYGNDNRGLRTMWFGKSWWDIDRNYGVHLWRWSRGAIADLLTPQTVREIDTSLFCAIRKLFDNVDNDGYISIESSKNPNCSIPRISDIVYHPRGLFAVYNFTTDVNNVKWVDQSGNNLHGWALWGTQLSTGPTNGSTARFFDEISSAVLPVPLGWDPRVGSINVRFQFDVNVLAYGQEMLLLKTSIDENGAIMIKLVMGQEGQQHSFINLIWAGTTKQSGSDSGSHNFDLRFPLEYVPCVTNRLHGTI